MPTKSRYLPHNLKHGSTLFFIHELVVRARQVVGGRQLDSVAQLLELDNWTL